MERKRNRVQRCRDMRIRTASKRSPDFLSKEESMAAAAYHFDPSGSKSVPGYL